MATYKVYMGHKRNGDVEVMAIDPDELEVGPGGAADFFDPGTPEPEYKGEIQITGDAVHLLSSWFSLNN
jgi:hypothetical protein